MPRIVLAWITLVAGCFFDAKYSEGVACSDGACPSGLVCHLGGCVTTIPIDMAADMLDGPPSALTCADPGVFPTNGDRATGTTAGATSKMSSSCGGFVNNGPDRVYRINMNGTDQLRVHIDLGARKAYVLASCVESPMTPVCLGNTRATLGNPIVVQPAAGFAYIVVDDENAAASGDYTLRVDIP